MISRILARLLGKRWSCWRVSYDILKKNQSRFRPNRSTADVKQILVLVQEHKTSLNAHPELLRLPDKDTDFEARLLDLQKAYPRVSELILLNNFERYAKHFPCLNFLKELHESTSSAINDKEGHSEQWTPELGLRKSCPTSLVNSNISQQVFMRLAESNRKIPADLDDHPIGNRWEWLPGRKIP